MENSSYVGIDIGTTNTVVCVTNSHGLTRLIGPKNSGKQLFRSILRFNSDNTVTLVQDLNNVQRDILKGNVVMNAKKIIGRKFDDEKVKKARASCKAKISKGDDGYAAFYIPAWNRLVSPEEVYTIIINNIWERVKETVGDVKIKGVAFTVPAEYKNEERAAIKRAIDASNMKCEYRMLSEPCAAAIAYGCNNTDRDGTYAMYDLGGGTFDTALIRIENGNTFSLLNVDGDPACGGSYFDDEIVNYIRRVFKEKAEGDIDLIEEEDGKSAEIEKRLRHDRTLYKLRECCREAKEELVTAKNSDIDLDSYGNFYRKEYDIELEEVNSGDPEFSDVDDSYNLTRDCFNGMIREQINNTITILERCIGNAGLENSDIKRILLVGGSSRILLVHQLLAERFGEGCTTESENPDEVVARGAALYSMHKDLRDISINETAKWDICTQVGKRRKVYYEPIIRRGEALPIVNRKKEYAIPPSNMGYFKDVIAEGRIEDESSMNVLKEFECDNITIEEKPTTIVYTWTMREDGILIYSVIEKETGIVHQPETVLHTD